MDPAVVARIVGEVKAQNQDAVQRMKLGQMDDANAFLQKSLHQCIGALSHPGLPSAAVHELRGMRAATLNNLGCLYKRTGANHDALRYLLEARDIETELLGAPGCSTLVNLSTVLAAVGSLDEALTIAKQCVKIAAAPRSDGTFDDYLIVLSLHNLAVTQQMCGPSERKHAATTMQRALREAQERLGADHPTTKTIHAKVEVRSGVKAPVMVPRPPAPTSGRSSGVSREHAQQALRSLQFSTPDAPAPLRIGNGAANPSATSRDLMAGAVFTETPRPDDGPLHRKEAGGALPAVAATSSPVAPTKEPFSPSMAPTSSPGGEALPPIVAGASKTAAAAAPTETPPPASGGSSSAALAVIRRRELRRTTPDGTIAPPPFARFALTRREVPPPAPITFADVRAERRLARVVDPSAEAAAVTAREAEEVAHRQAQHVAKLAQRRAEKLRREREEEALARQQRARAAEAQRREEARLQRAEAALQRRRNYAAKVIQNVFRKWYFTVRARRPRIITNRGGAKYGGGDGGASDTLRIVKRCARRWLDKTAGPRLAIRIAGSKRDMGRVVAGVRAFQLLWRRHAAQRRRRVLIARRDDGWLTRRAWERLHFAALVIQCAYRRFHAVRRVAAVREQHYRDFVVRLQRWGRRVAQHRAWVERLTRDATRQRRAAITIQKTWRRYQALLTYSVLLLKKKIATMRRRELRAALAIQRVARAFQTRRRVADAVGTRRRDLAAADAFARQRAAAFAASQRPLPPLTPPHLVPFLDRERRGAAMAQVPVDRALYIELAVESQRAQVVEAHSPGPSQRATTLSRAAEAHRRSLELNTLRRFRAAKTIQRFFRRCRTLDTPERRSHRVYARAALQKRHFDGREAARVEAEHRDHVHATVGDPALPVRELLAEARAELMATPPVRRHLPDEVLQGLPVAPADRLREIEEREAAARRLRDEERALEAAMVREAEALRQVRIGGKAFRTVREQRSSSALSLSAAAAAPLAITPGPSSTST